MAEWNYEGNYEGDFEWDYEPGYELDYEPDYGGDYEWDYVPEFVGQARAVAIELVNQKAILVDLAIGKQNLGMWTPESWRRKPVAHETEYHDPAALEATCLSLRQLPPLFSSQKIEQALWELSEVAQGKSFIIQGGDCAENFLVQLDIIKGKFTLLAEMTEILSRALQKSIVQIGPIASQYAPQRSNSWDVLSNGEKMQVFRDQNVNLAAVCDRTSNPQPLLSGYFYAATTLNAIRRFESENEIEAGTLDFGSPTTLYTSHEALHLPYESSLTKRGYNHSATFLWISERTNQIDGAHIEYARDLQNPIAIKIGPATTPAAIVKLLDILSPNRSHVGKVSIITSFGRGNAESILPPIVRAVQHSGHLPVWICDPCERNTIMTAGGLKLRVLGDILAELEETYIVHRNLGNYLGGIHLEQTGDEVAEYQYEFSGPEAMDSKSDYRSSFDQRVSRFQALALVESFGAFVNGYEEGLGAEDINLTID